MKIKAEQLCVYKDGEEVPLYVLSNVEPEFPMSELQATFAKHVSKHVATEKETTKEEVFEPERNVNIQKIEKPAFVRGGLRPVIPFNEMSQKQKIIKIYNIKTKLKKNDELTHDKIADLEAALAEIRERNTLSYEFQQSLGLT